MHRGQCHRSADRAIGEVGGAGQQHGRALIVDDTAADMVPFPGTHDARGFEGGTETLRILPVAIDDGNAHDGWSSGRPEPERLSPYQYITQMTKSSLADKVAVGHSAVLWVDLRLPGDVRGSVMDENGLERLRMIAGAKADTASSQASFESRSPSIFRSRRSTSRIGAAPPRGRRSIGRRSGSWLW